MESLFTRRPQDAEDGKKSIFKFIQQKFSRHLFLVLTIFERETLGESVEA